MLEMLQLKLNILLGFSALKIEIDYIRLEKQTRKKYKLRNTFYDLWHLAFYFLSISRVILFNTLFARKCILKK